MSRSEYSDGYDGWALIRWRGAVASAIRGKRGQAFLRALRDALDAMPEKRLVAQEFQRLDGEVCAIGAMAKQRGVDLGDDWKIYGDARGLVAEMFDIAESLAAEVMYVNDEWEHFTAAPELRWRTVRDWVESKITAVEKAAEVNPDEESE